MKNLIPPFLAIILLANCHDAVESEFTQFVVKVDSITHSSFAASNDTIAIRFFGTIGNDGCCSFSRFEISRQPLQLDVTVWGQRQGADACPDVIVSLNGREYRFVPGGMGWYRIVVHQPSGGMIRDSIIVK